MNTTIESIARPDRPLAQKWRQHLEAWRSSGTTQVAFCRSNGLSRYAFQYWKTQLAAERKPPSRFIELPASALASSAAIEIVVNERFHLRVPEGIGAEHLKTVLSVVSQLVEPS